MPSDSLSVDRNGALLVDYAPKLISNLLCNITILQKMNKGDDRTCKIHPNAPLSELIKDEGHFCCFLLQMR